jgi:hypothetical protein
MFLRNFYYSIDDKYHKTYWKIKASRGCARVLGALWFQLSQNEVSVFEAIHDVTEEQNSGMFAPSSPK